MPSFAGVSAQTAAKSGARRGRWASWLSALTANRKPWTSPSAGLSVAGPCVAYVQVPASPASQNDQYRYPPDRPDAAGEAEAPDATVAAEVPDAADAAAACAGVPPAHAASTAAEAAARRIRLTGCYRFLPRPLSRKPMPTPARANAPITSQKPTP